MMSGKKITIAFLLFIFVGVSGYFIYKFISIPTLKSGNYDTAIVDRGNVTDYVPAKGVVEPGSEVLLLCPEASVIKEIVMEPGSHVEAGASIIILDPKPIQDQIESLKDQLEVKQNNPQC